MSSGEDIDSIVRRMIAKDLKCNIESVVDEFDWLSQTNHEDAGWFLAAIQDRFNRTIFPSFINEDLLHEIATSRGLIAYVRRKFDEDAARR
jgi:hypothetical protein